LEYQQLIGQFPGTDAQLKQLLKLIRDIDEMARYTPASEDESEQWSSIVSTAEKNRQKFCSVLNGNNLFSTLYITYTVVLHELKAVLKTSTPAGQSKTPKSAATQEYGFKEVRGVNGKVQKRLPQLKDSSVYRRRQAPPLKEAATRNFFAPLRESDMDTDSTKTEATPREAAAPAKPGRPPSKVLTSAVNLFLLQKQLRFVVSENFEFRSTRNGTRVITRNMSDFQSVKLHIDSQNLSYFSFFSKPEKPINSVIRHLPHNTPTEDTSDGLVSLGFDVVSVKQMTATRRSPPEESKIINLPLFLVTLPRRAKSKEIFRLSSLCHIAIRVEAYKAQNALTQCHNCQQFGLVWACGAEAVTYKEVPRERKYIFHPNMLQLSIGGRRNPLSSEFNISAPQCPTHYSSAGNGDMLNIVVHQNSRVSDVIVSDILDSDHLPIIFHILHHIKIRNLSEPIENLEIWIGFKTSLRN
jgi:hypothetical protein